MSQIQRTVALYLSTLLSDPVNFFFISVVFPEAMKYLWRTWYKKGNPISWNSYRLVLIVSVEYFNTNNIILKNQHDSVKRKSTMAVMCCVVKGIVHELDCWHFSAGVFCDLREVFCMVDLDLFLRKMSEVSFRGLVAGDNMYKYGLGWGQSMCDHTSLMILPLWGEYLALSPGVCLVSFNHQPSPCLYRIL